MDGFEVVTLDDDIERADIIVTATGNKDILTVDQMRRVKDMAIVCNIGHFDNEIQVAGLKNIKWTNIKPQVDLIEFPAGNRMILLSEGRLVNLGNATGHPSFVMSASFANQTLAQIELWTKGDQYKNSVYVLPEASRRKGGHAAPGQDRRQADQAVRRPGRVTSASLPTARSSRKPTATDQLFRHLAAFSKLHYPVDKISCAGGVLLAPVPLYILRTWRVDSRASTACLTALAG